jgi:hypothetical protein
MAVILGLHRGHLDHLPHVMLTLLVPHQHTQQLAHVQPITLGATTAAVHLNGGGIHHLVGDPMRLQKSVQPEPFATCSIATDYGGRFRQTQAAFGLGDFVEHTFLMSRGHGALARLLPMPGGEAKLPGFFTQFKGHKQGPLCLALLHIASRWGGHGLSPP